jgi:hypothetical protein
MRAGVWQEHMPGGALHDQPGPPRVAVTRLEVICLGKSASGEMGIHDVHINSFSALPSHFEAKKGLLSRFRQVVAPLRRVVLALRRALAALRRVVRPLRRALAALRRVVRALRRALAALRRVVRALRRALAALRRVVLALRRALAALRPVLFHGFDALQRLPEPVMSGRDSLACALFGKKFLKEKVRS